MKAEIVTYVRDKWVVLHIESPDLATAISFRGYSYLGPSTNKALREELQGQPKFKELAGPMWGGADKDGVPIIRYEDYKAYERLSQ